MGAELQGQMPLIVHWPVVEREAMAYTVEGEPRVVHWDRTWCACGDRSCQRAWPASTESLTCQGRLR